MADYQNPFLGQQNPQLQGVIDSAQGDLVRNYNLTAQPAFNAAMLKSGSFGNAGVQQMNENGQLNLQKSLGDVGSKLRFNDYTQQQDMYKWDQDFGRTLYNDSFSQNQQNLQTGIGLLGTMNQFNNQNLQNGTTIQNTPLNYYQQFANTANSIGQGYGNSTTTQGTSSNPAMQALGGAQLGNSLWNQYNSNSGQGSNWTNGSGNYSQYTNTDYGQFL